ncbi:hypothetical protein OSTOST_01212 [Ostertagia ostertagi]
MAYHNAAVRMLVLGIDGIAHDTGNFVKANFNRNLLKFWYNMPDEYWSKSTVTKRLTPGLQRAYKALDGRPSTRKLLVLLLQDVPDDIDQAKKELDRMKEESEAHVEVFVGSRRGHADERFVSMSTSGLTYKIPDNFLISDLGHIVASALHKIIGPPA